MAVQTEHSWELTAIVSISTCTKCGLLKLKTLHNTYYFAQLLEPLAGCKHTFAKDLAENALVKQKTKTANGSSGTPSRGSVRKE